MIHPSGYYAWKRNPESACRTEDARLLGHIKQSWLESSTVYGYQQVHEDLREPGKHPFLHGTLYVMSLKQAPATPLLPDLPQIRHRSLA